jgi:hypothetical protein
MAAWAKPVKKARIYAANVVNRDKNARGTDERPPPMGHGL